MVGLRERIQRIGLFVKSALFTIVIHGILLAVLLVGQWPFAEESIKRGTTKPIQAQVISTDYIQQKKAAKLAQEKKKREQAEKRLKEAEKKKKHEQEKKRLVVEKKHQQEAQKKRLEAEKKKKREQEKKRLAVEKKRQQEAQKKRLEAERLKREQELKQELEKESILRQQAQTKGDAETALTALMGRIASAVENNWRLPLSGVAGLEVKIRVKVSRNGDVLSVNVVKSSGDFFFDQSIEQAVLKASPLPFPSNPKYYEFISVFDIKYPPDDH